MTPATTKTSQTRSEPTTPSIHRTLSFRNRILFGFLGLLVLLQGSTALMSRGALIEGVTLQMSEALETSQRLFKSEQQSRNDYLKVYSGTMAQDFALQRAISFKDQKTLNSTLQNHISRFHADIAFINDFEGENVGGTLELSKENQREIFQDLDPREDRSYVQVVNINEQFYQLISTPLTRGDVNAWLSIGFEFDQTLAQHFQEITDLDVSFVALEGDTLRVVATTLPKIDARLPAMRLQMEQLKSGEAHFLTNAEHTLQAGQVIGQTNNETLLVVIQKSREGIFGSLTDWWMELLGFFSLSLLAVSVVAALIARSVTEPIEALLRLVKKATSGEYETQIENCRKDEIGELAAEFQSMNLAVAERERKIRFQAERDALTGLQKREVFVNTLASDIQQATQKHPKFYVGLVNINRFKEINDTLGHDNGDQLLLQVSERLKKIFNIRHLARHGADQFLFFQPMDNYGQLNELRKNILEVFTEVFAQSGIKIVLSATMGVATYPEHSKDATTLLRLAEIAISSAKDRRLDFALYDKKNDNHSVQRLSLMSDLPAAIENGELELYYQPTLSLHADGGHRLTKAECLVRWHHPSYGFIPPDDFIALAEQSGSITLLTQWVLKTALTQCQAWQQRGLEIGVAVNISAIDLFRGDLQSRVPKLLQHYGIPSHMLTLEVTESEIMEDPEQACAILRSINALGVRLSVDDYGTGYSSLAHLKQLPVHELKIDKSFVLDMSRDKDDATIVKSTIELGHTMGLTVVAEGVEDKHTLTMLSELGCNYAQGYFISKPMPITEVDKWLSETDYTVTLSSLQGLGSH
jgi:diguanylate cyclase (GGDEF)-like protein